VCSGCEKIGRPLQPEQAAQPAPGSRQPLEQAAAPLPQKGQAQTKDTSQTRPAGASQQDPRRRPQPAPCSPRPGTGGQQAVQEPPQSQGQDIEEGDHTGEGSGSDQSCHAACDCAAENVRHPSAAAPQPDAAAHAAKPPGRQHEGPDEHSVWPRQVQPGCEVPTRVQRFRRSR
jgi:hypothetical protein